MRDVIVILLILGCAAKALRNPVFGVLAYVCFTITNPTSFAFGFARTFPLGKVIVAATLVGMFVSYSEPKTIPRHREFWALLVLWGMFTISTIFSLHPDDALKMYEKVSKVILMTGVIAILINSPDRLRQFLRVIALSIGTFALAAAVFVVRTGGQEMVWGPEDTFLEANNSIGMAFAMNLPFLWYLQRAEANKWIRRIMWAMMSATVPATLCTFSRGAWLGLAAAIISLIWHDKRRVRLVLLGVLVAAFLAPIAVQFSPERVTSRAQELKNYESETSAQSRFWNWEYCARVGLARPVTGGGFDFYATDTMQTYFPEYLEQWSTVVHSCHSMWFTILGEHGVLAFALWLALIVWCYLSLRDIRRFGEREPDKGWMAEYSSMIKVALVTYGVTGAFLDTAYFDLFYFMIAAIVIMKEHMKVIMKTKSRRVLIQEEIGKGSIYAEGAKSY